MKHGTIKKVHQNLDCTEIPLVWFGRESNKKSEKEELILICHQGKKFPERAVKSKIFIQKVMFMTAVARPCWDHISKKMFDGKIGLWPFVTYDHAKYNSKNRLKGTIVTKPIASVNKDIVREMILRNLIPAIKRKMPLRKKK